MNKFNEKYNEVMGRLKESSDAIKDIELPKGFKAIPGSCMYASELLTRQLLAQGISDFSVIEGYITFDDYDWEDTHTWIETDDGKIIDKTSGQWGIKSDIIYLKHKRKKYTPKQYLDLCKKYPEKNPSKYLAEAFEDQHIATGSGRKVYKKWVGGKRIIRKVAYNDDGLAQNAEEIKFDKRYGEYSDIVAPLLDYDKENDSPTWVEFKLASPFSETKFEKYTGYSFDDFAMFLAYYYKLNKNQKRPVSAATETKIKDSDFFKRLVKVIDSSKLKAAEFVSSENWGMIGDKPVIIDLGKVS